MIKIFNLLEDTSTTESRLYCDLDGVLVNFEKGYKDLTGNTPPPYGTPYDKRAFWEPIEKAGASFWINLEWMPDGKALWNYIKEHKPTILSAPAVNKSSVEGKAVWMSANLPNVPFVLKPAKKKHELAAPQTILIDDREDTIERWENASGIGILHTSTKNTIKQLRQLGF